MQTVATTVWSRYFISTDNRPKNYFIAISDFEFPSLHTTTSQLASYTIICEYQLYNLKGYFCVKGIIKSG